MSFYIKVAAFCAGFMLVFGLIGLVFWDEPVRGAVAGVLPGVGVAFGFLTVRERDANRAEAARKAKAEAEAAEAE